MPSDSGGPTGRGVAEENLVSDGADRGPVPAATTADHDDPADDATTVLSAEELVRATSRQRPMQLFADDDAGWTLPGTVLRLPSPAARCRSAVASEPLTPGTTIGGRYRLVSLVSADAAGHWFWRAKDTVLPRDMAVTILPDTTGASATVARTLRAGRLHHIGLPQTLDVGTDHGQSYVVGQWVDGATAAPTCCPPGRWSPTWRPRSPPKISEAVAEAHRNGIALGAINPVADPGQLRRTGAVLARHRARLGDPRPGHPGRRRAAVPDAHRHLAAARATRPRSALAGPDRATIPPAPTSLGRELPADEVNPAVPGGPVRAGRTRAAPGGTRRHPRRRRDRGAAAQPGNRRSRRGGTARRRNVRSAPPTARLIKERRVKLSAGGGRARGLRGADRHRYRRAGQPVPGLRAEQRTRTTCTMIDSDTSPSAQPAGPAASPNAAGTTGQSPTAATTPAAATVPIVDGTVYDPQGDGNPDYKAYVDRAYDGNPDSAWLTWVYKQQFPSLKTGVGLILRTATGDDPDLGADHQRDTGDHGGNPIGDRHRPSRSIRPRCWAPGPSPTSR